MGGVVEPPHDPFLGRDHEVEIEALSGPAKANGSDPVACASSSPMVPPWVKTATRWST